MQSKEEQTKSTKRGKPKHIKKKTIAQKTKLSTDKTKARKQYTEKHKATNQ